MWPCNVLYNAMAINWCIQCGCQIKNEAPFCYAYNELMANDDDKDIKTS